MRDWGSERKPGTLVPRLIPHGKKRVICLSLRAKHSFSKRVQGHARGEIKNRALRKYSNGGAAKEAVCQDSIHRCGRQ